jgi:hypothetical protein
MAAYGKGQMLGSGINPESFKLDFGGFADAARMQAQGIAGLGQSIGGAIQNYGEVKKEQKKVDAYNKASAKSIEAAITLGKSYGITAAEETLAPFLQSYNDPNLSPIEKAALLDEGKAMIPNVFGRFDQDQVMNARNTTGGKNVNLQQGEIIETINGKQYKVPVVFDPETGIRTRPDGTVVGTPATASGITSALSLPASQGTGGLQNKSNAIVNALELPTDNLYTNDTSLLPPLNTGVESEVPTLLPFEGSQPNASVPSYAIPVEADEKQGQVMSPEEVSKLIQQGYKISGTPAENGQIFVTDIQSLAPQKGEEIIFNSDGTVTKRDISLGGKAAQAQKAEDAKIDKAMGLTQDLNLLEKASESMAPGVLAATGRMVAEQIPATQQAETKDIIDRVNSMLTLSGIQEMRANNPTGAALGNVSDKDMAVLRSSVTALRNAQSPAAFKRELIRLKNLQHDLIYGSERVLKSKLDKGEITQSQFSQAMANAPTEYLDKEGEIKSRTAPESVPTSGSSNIYEKYGVK